MLSWPAPETLSGAGFHRPLLMGIVNVTPDSFSDGGETFRLGDAVRRGIQHAEDGAEIVDVGGESTRPGAAPVDPESEMQRVLPVVRELAAAGLTVSIDTRHGQVMAAAIEAGAAIVNDITALTGDPRSLEIVAKSRANVILMHMKGEPRTMQAAPSYGDVLSEVYAWLEARVRACEAAGIGRSRIAVDPGIGFGKTTDHNLSILAGLDMYQGLGCAVVAGASRKRFIGQLSRNEPPRERVAGSVAAALWAAQKGAHILRVHDIAATRQALAVWGAIAGAASGSPSLGCFATNN